LYTVGVCWTIRQLAGWPGVWIDLHRDELMADWDLAAAGEEPFRIAPLQ
jgi:hypothetical protein